MSQLWDAEADTFDDEPDHGLADPQTRAAWRDLLLGVLPPTPARIADLGCGTGTLSGLLVDEGYSVDGLDFSPEMIQRARRKVPESTFVVGDASAPDLEPASYDVVLSRHVLWALPDPVAAFARWVDLLKPGGSVVLVEGSLVDRSRPHRSGDRGDRPDRPHRRGGDAAARVGLLGQGHRRRAVPRREPRVSGVAARPFSESPDTPLPVT